MPYPTFDDVAKAVTGQLYIELEKSAKQLADMTGKDPVFCELSILAVLQASAVNRGAKQ